MKVVFNGLCNCVDSAAQAFEMSQSPGALKANQTTN